MEFKQPKKDCFSGRGMRTRLPGQSEPRRSQATLARLKDSTDFLFKVRILRFTKNQAVQKGLLFWQRYKDSNLK